MCSASIHEKLTSYKLKVGQVKCKSSGCKIHISTMILMTVSQWWREAGEDCNEGLHNLYASSNIIRVIRSKEDEMGGTCSRHMEEMRNAYNILTGKLEWKRSLGRPRRRWGDNIRTDLKKVGWEGRLDAF